MNQQEIPMPAFIAALKSNKETGFQFTMVLGGTNEQQEREAKLAHLCIKFLYPLAEVQQMNAMKKRKNGGCIFHLQKYNENSVPVYQSSSDGPLDEKALEQLIKRVQQIVE